MWLCCSWATFLALFFASPTSGNDWRYPARVAREPWVCAWLRGSHYMQPTNISLPCHHLCSHPSQPFSTSDPRDWEIPGASGSWGRFLGLPALAWANLLWELSKALHQAYEHRYLKCLWSDSHWSGHDKNVGLPSTVTWSSFRSLVVGFLPSPGSIRGWQFAIYPDVT